MLDKTALGHTSAHNAAIVQSFNAGAFGIFNIALWNRPDGPVLYMQTSNGWVSAHKMSGNRFGTTPMAQSVNQIPVPYQGMTVSSNRAQPGTGILWATEADTWPLPCSGTLHAFNADDLSEIWNSDMNAGDTLGGFVRFANPTVANGKVYVPTASNHLVVYGLNGVAAGTAPTVTGVVNAASYAGGPVAPGEIVAIFGQNLGPQNLTAGSFDANGQMTTLIAGTQIFFGGLPAPLLYTSAGVAAAVVPYAVAGQDAVAFQVSRNGQTSVPLNLPTGGGSAWNIFRRWLRQRPRRNSKSGLQPQFAGESRPSRIHHRGLRDGRWPDESGLQRRQDDHGCRIAGRRCFRGGWRRAGKGSVCRQRGRRSCGHSANQRATACRRDRPSPHRGDRGRPDQPSYRDCIHPLEQCPRTHRGADDRFRRPRLSRNRKKAGQRGTMACPTSSRF